MDGDSQSLKKYVQVAWPTRRKHLSHIDDCLDVALDKGGAALRLETELRVLLHVLLPSESERKGHISRNYCSC